MLARFVSEKETGEETVESMKQEMTDFWGDPVFEDCLGTRAEYHRDHPGCLQCAS